MIRSVLVAAALVVWLSTSVLAYNFWGIDMGTQSYNGASQLTFSNVPGSGVSYSVGSYQYVKVDSTWYGPFAAAEPGTGYSEFRDFQADGLFFRATSSGADFMILTGMPNTGVTVADCGYGNRQFGPGDLKVDVGSNTYGVGLRQSGLLWAEDPNSTLSYYQCNKAQGGVDNMHAADTGTKGVVELNPQWDHLDNPDLAPGSSAAYALYVAGSGTKAGTSSVSIADTGVKLGGVDIYAYETIVPWAVLGLTSNNYAMTASWRPECGNDLITLGISGHSGINPVPEPASVLAISVGVVGLVMRRKRRRTNLLNI